MKRAQNWCLYWWENRVLSKNCSLKYLCITTSRHVPPEETLEHPPSPFLEGSPGAPPPAGRGWAPEPAVLQAGPQAGPIQGPRCARPR